MANLVAAVNQLNSMQPNPDVVLLTGDLTDDGSEAAYRKLRECLELLRIPYFVISGNHDDATNFKKAFADHRYLPGTGSSLHYVVEEFPLRLIGLDTTVAGEVGGRICEARRQWLNERLREQPERPTLIFMHHPPLQTGIFGLNENPFSGDTELETLVGDVDSQAPPGRDHRLRSRSSGDLQKVRTYRRYHVAKHGLPIYV